MKMVARYEDLCVRYPEAVAKIIAKLRRGKSVHREALPETLHWEYTYGIRHDDGAVTVRGLEERIAERSSQTFVAVSADIGRWWGSSSITGVPEEIVRMHRIEMEEREAQEARVRALSPEERSQERDKALRDASAYPGFVAFRPPHI